MYGTVGVHIRCSEPSRKYSARASSDAEDGKERTGSCAGIGLGGRTREEKAAVVADDS